MQIIVLGMHRSGTSLVTRLVNMMGAYVASDGQTIGYNEENPKGFWERRDVIECNDRILAQHGCTWDRLSKWPFSDDAAHNAPPLPHEVERELKEIILDMDAHRPWVIKDPRLCLTFSHWRRHLEVPVIVLVTRDPVEVAYSLAARDAAQSVPYGVALWEVYSFSALKAIQGLPVIRIAHAEMLRDPVRVTQALHAALTVHGVAGLRLPSDAEITAFVQPSLYRAKNHADASGILNGTQQALAQVAAQGDGQMPSAISPTTPDIFAWYDAAQMREQEYQRLQAAHAQLEASLNAATRTNVRLSGLVQQFEQELKGAREDFATLNSARTLRFARILGRLVRRSA